MKAKDLIPYQTPEFITITDCRQNPVECPVVSIEWKEEVVRGEPILTAIVGAMFPFGRVIKDRITFVIKNGVFTQNSKSVPQAFRFVDYSEMTPEEIEDSKHPTGALSAYWAKKSYNHKKAEKEERNELKHEKLTAWIFRTKLTPWIPVRNHYYLETFL